MTAGLAKGLSHADAARFSFLLATPVILAAGQQAPDIETRSLRPFGIYCLVAGLGYLVWFTLR